MPRMNESELRKVKDESDQADKVWREKGLTGENQSGKIGGVSLLKHMDAYRGDQWKNMGWLGGVDPDAHVVINSLFAAFNAMQAQLLARNPKVSVFGRSAQYAAKAKPFANTLNYLIPEVKINQRAWSPALRDALFRVGFVRVGYTPPAERVGNGDEILELSPTILDVPWMRRVAPWDIRIDPLAESWHADHDAGWCEFISLMTLDQIKKNPGMTTPRDLKATISKDKRMVDERKMRSDPYFYEAGNLVEVRTRYDARERKWFQWSPGSDKCLRDPDDWPRALQGIEGLPYSMLSFNPQSDDPCPIGYADILWPLQMERNKVRTLLNELVKRMKRYIFANKNAFADGEWQKLADGDVTEVFGMTGNPGEAATVFSFAGFDQGLLMYDQMIQTDIREILGQSLMARAQRINVKSATEASKVAEGDQSLTARNQLTVEDWLRDSVRLYAKAVQGTVTADILVPVVGAQDAAELMAGQDAVIQIRPEDIQGEFMFDIEIGSSMPRNEQQEIGKAMAWLELAQQFPQNINIPDALLQVALAMGKDPKTALMNAQQVGMTNEAVMNQPPTEPAKGTINPAALLMQGSDSRQ